MILNYAANRGPKYDTQFAIASIRQLKSYAPHYILEDRAYDTEPIRKCINEEAKAEDQIPLKTRAKTGHYRLKSKKQFNQEIYSRRNNVESIFSVIKRIFNGTNRSRSLQLSNKETKLKNTIYNIYRSTQIQIKMRISTKPNIMKVSTYIRKTLYMVFDRLFVDVII